MNPLDSDTTTTEATADIAAMTPTTTTSAPTEAAATSVKSPSLPLPLSAHFATATITGTYNWRAEHLDKNGCLIVGILRDDEDGPADKKGRRPLTSATLTKGLSERFLAASGETIFLYRTRMAITIRTENFAADLSAGVGRVGTGKGGFIGQSIDLNP